MSCKSDARDGGDRAATIATHKSSQPRRATSATHSKTGAPTATISKMRSAHLSGRYHALRDEVERSRDREAELDFKPVTEAYLDVEREMRRVGDRDRDVRARLISTR